jgi:hypothetical protein
MNALSSGYNALEKLFFADAEILTIFVKGLIGFFDFGVSLLRRLLLGAPESF